MTIAKGDIDLASGFESGAIIFGSAMARVIQFGGCNGSGVRWDIETRCTQESRARAAALTTNGRSANQARRPGVDAHVSFAEEDQV